MALALATLLIALVLVWALRTESGARYLVHMAMSQVKAQVSVDEVTGSFAEGVTLADIRLVSEAASLQIDRVTVAIEISALLKRSLTIRDLSIDNVTIIFARNVTASDPDKSELELPATLNLPLDIVVIQLRVTNVRLGSEDEDLTTIVERLSANASWIATVFELNDVELLSSFGSLSASAAVTTREDYPVLLIARTRVTLPGIAPIQSSTRLGGSLQELEIEHSSDSPYLFSVEGIVQEPLTVPDMKVHVNARQIDIGQISDTLPDIQVKGEVSLTGVPGDLAATGRVTSSLPAVGQYVARFNGTVSRQDLRLSALSIELSEVENTPELRASGVVSLRNSTPDVDLELDWDRLRWPFQGEPVVRSLKGTMSLKGTPEVYGIELLGDVATRHEVGGNIALSAHGSPERIRIDPVRLQALNGAIKGHGEISLVDRLSFVATLEGKDINPGSLNQSWPGKLDFNVAGSGTATDSGIEAAVTRLVGKGRLRGYPVSFDGKGLITPKRLNLERFDMRTGSTTMSASGEVAERIRLEWRMNSGDLGSLWPGLEGQVDARGEAGGTMSLPTVKFALKGKDLKFQDMAATEIDANISFDGARAASSTIAVIAGGFTSGPYVSKRLGIDARGAVESHIIEIETEDNLGTGSALIEGSLTDAERYDFNLRQFRLAPADLGVWSLATPASGRVTKSAFNLAETCLGQDRSTLCLSLDAAQNSLAVNVAVAEVPLSLFAYLVPAAVKARGIVNGGGNMLMSADGGSSGRIHFDLDPLILESRFRQETRDSTLVFDQSTLTASVDDAGELVLDARFPLLSGGGLEISGNVAAGEEKLLERTVRGALSLSVPSVNFVTDYIPQISQAEGQIEGVIRLAGSLQRPELLGSFDLTRGAVTLSDPGVQASDVSLKLTGNRDNSFLLAGSAKSGGGDISLNGILQLNDRGSTGRFDLKGSSFQVLNTPESKVWASPDVSLEYENNALTLEGTVEIPRANVEIDALPEGTRKVSRDQVIVGQRDSKDSAVIPLTAELELQLGDDVHLSAFGLDAFLAGAITLRETDNSPTTASGEINLKEGVYQAYGQKLSITTGRLVYAGGPLDEPGIDLRAIRKPTAEIEVGVSARGTLNQPTFSVFSDPAMSDSDQLAYLIFGRPMNAEASSENTLITRAALTLGMRGGGMLTQKLADDLGIDQLGIESEASGDLSQASLVIGKYLSPRLFVSYGIGLLEPVSTLKLEYALSSRWHLVTESSSTLTSADAQYTYER